MTCAIHRWPCVIAIILSCLSGMPADAQQTPDAREIIRKMDLILRGDTSHGRYRMTIQDPDWQRTLTFEAWEDRKAAKTFIRIQSPAKEKGIVTLKIRYEMWNYLPRVERIIKIPPSMMLQPWMGSDFTNDDLVKASSFVTDYDHTVVAEETLQGIPAYKLELTPHADAPVVWGRILVWVVQQDSMPLRQEFYSERGDLIRVLEFSDIRPVHGRRIPTRWVMTPVQEKGRRTTMEVEDLRIDVPVDAAIFSIRNLKKLR